MARALTRTFTLCLATALTLPMLGCMTTNPDVVRYDDMQRMATVQEATVVAVRPVTVEGQQTGLGAVAGGMVGSMAGSGVGGYRDGFVGSILGAVAGAVVGNAIERGTTRENAVELTLQLKNGDRRMIIQGQGREVFQPGDAVTVVTNGSRARVSHTTPSAAPANAPARPAPVYTPSSGNSTRPTPVYTPS